MDQAAQKFTLNEDVALGLAREICDFALQNAGIAVDQGLESDAGKAHQVQHPEFKDPRVRKAVVQGVVLVLLQMAIDLLKHDVEGSENERGVERPGSAKH